MQTYETNKRYISRNLTDPEVFSGIIEDCEMPEALLKKLSKELGFSYELYNSLVSIDPKVAASLVDTMCNRLDRMVITLLVNPVEHIVLGYTLEADREPLLNKEFMDRVSRIITSSDAIEVTEEYCLEDSTIATVLVKKKSPVIVREMYENKDPIPFNYDIGILAMNDELGTVSCRLVLYVDGHPVYLPASLYSLTASRYKRSTSSSAEALEVLILRIIDDLRDDILVSKIQDLHYRYRYNKNIVASYEEYNTLMNTLRKIPTIIEDNSALSPMLHIYDDFERRYMNLVDKKSSYLWRCTALGDVTIESLMRTTCTILNTVNAPVMEYFTIRELLGSFVNTPRIAEDIADTEK